MAMDIMGPHFFIVLVLAVAKLNAHEETKVTIETVKSEDDIYYITPKSHPDVFFADHFDDETEFQKKWIKSKAMKAGVEETIAKYDGEWALEKAAKDPLIGDLGLVMKSKAKHAAISAPFGKVFKFDEKPLVVQYELNFQVLMNILVYSCFPRAQVIFNYHGFMASYIPKFKVIDWLNFFEIVP